MKIDNSNLVEKKHLYFPELDGLRFIAFILVFIHHFIRLNIKPFSILNDRGWFGVELFFILSSFLLTKLLVEEIRRNKKISILNFFIRRILRIWPLYFLYIIFIVIIFGLPKIITSYTIGRLIGLFTFTENIWSSILGYNNTILYIGHLWTISLEEQYYLFLPFLIPFIIKINKKYQWIIGISLLTLLIIFRTISVLLKIPHPFIWVLPIQGDALLLGTLYGLGLFEDILNKINSIFKIVIGTILLIYTYYLPNVNFIGYNQVIIYTIIAIGFLLIVDGIIKDKSKWSKRILGNPVLCYFGKISYGLYIYHIILIQLIITFITKYKIINLENYTISWVIYFVIVLLSTIFISCLSYELYEKKFLKLKKNFSSIISRSI